MYVIIKSNKKKQQNWSGKEWSELPCKIYSSMEDAMDAIKHYWYGGYNLDTHDSRPVTFIPLTEKKKQQAISKAIARL